MTGTRTRTDQNAADAQPDRAPVSEDLRRRLLAPLPVTERRLRLNGVSTAVLEGGQGSPVVLLHGPGGYAAQWLRIIPGLVATHRVIAPDLPGHGASDPIEGPFDVNRVLAWLDDLIECTCTTPPAVVGRVTGGAMAARFAAVRGERLSLLVLVDVLGLVPFQPAPEFGLALTEFIAQPTEETHDRLMGRCAFDLNGLRHQLGEQWHSMKAYTLDRASTPALRGTQQRLMELLGFPPIPPAELARIAVPTRLIWGRHDLATPLSVAQAASTSYGWPLQVIENAANDAAMDQPEEFLVVLRGVLEQR